MEAQKLFKLGEDMAFQDVLFSFKDTIKSCFKYR